MRTKRRGMTLLEVMTVVVLLVSTVLLLISVLVTSLNYTRRAKELSVAVDDLKDIFERIKSAPFVSIATQFPNGAAINPTMIGGFFLPNEQIVVNYPNGTGADPLEIDVTITWRGAGGQMQSYTGRTLRTGML